MLKQGEISDNVLRLVYESPNEVWADVPSDANPSSQSYLIEL